ncbi:MAG: hypothetical protein HN742_24260 [Lentisphaerae bacterium]|jgi:hypothetical protein|nr:hypothetical protein [Lentisphaerota bacterium]MBT4817950.1 hypothetical protein [Lentisphaerota bacterium]MBT5611139.1 hypothetical protein [Lentisphaerota bacterium]MBT7059250.1 hypothetical protein [Lentisphaerota bacterium]MBT7845013.1 hypothetical protein [Lentisphaerota bacterium]
MLLRLKVFLFGLLVALQFGLGLFFVYMPAVRGDRWILGVTNRYQNLTKPEWRQLHPEDTYKWSLTDGEVRGSPERIRVSYSASVTDGMTALRELRWTHGLVSIVFILDGLLILAFYQAWLQRLTRDKKRGEPAPAADAAPPGAPPSPPSAQRS